MACIHSWYSQCWFRQGSYGRESVKKLLIEDIERQNVLRVVDEGLLDEDEAVLEVRLVCRWKPIERQIGSIISREIMHEPKAIPRSRVGSSSDIVLTAAASLSVTWWFISFIPYHMRE